MHMGSFNKQATPRVPGQGQASLCLCAPSEGCSRSPLAALQEVWRGCGWSNPGITGQKHIFCEQERGFAQDNCQWAFPRI